MAVTSWKMLAAATVWLVMTSVDAAIGMYDEVPPGEMGLMYPEQSYIDPGAALAPDSNVDSAMRGFLVYKMLSSLRNRDASPSILAGPKWITSDTVLAPPDTIDLPLMKGPMAKKLSDVDSTGHHKFRDLGKPLVQKWKIKKGKVGSQMICYFKLCAFRSPM